jgi:SulP family sulfate permease
MTVQTPVLDSVLDAMTSRASGIAALAAPCAVHTTFIPGGGLVVVRWNMVEKKEFGRLLGSWCTAAVLLATFALTLVENLTFGIVEGCVLAALFALFKRPVPEEGE